MQPLIISLLAAAFDAGRVFLDVTNRHKAIVEETRAKIKALEEETRAACEAAHEEVKVAYLEALRTSGAAPGSAEAKEIERLFDALTPSYLPDSEEYLQSLLNEPETNDEPKLKNVDVAREPEAEPAPTPETQAVS